MCTVGATGFLASVGPAAGIPNLGLQRTTHNPLSLKIPKFQTRDAKSEHQDARKYEQRHRVNIVGQRQPWVLDRRCRSGRAGGAGSLCPDDRGDQHKQDKDRQRAQNWMISTALLFGARWRRSSSS
jgi:hypothetical protein